MQQIVRQAGFSLLELLAVVAILGILAVAIVPRAADSNGAADIAGCQVNKGDIEIQVELWRHNTGAMPDASLANIGAELNYFPAGLPVCPVDGTAYTIDPATGLVVGHTH